MISVYLLLLVPTVTLAGVEIVESPEAFTWVEQGEEIGQIALSRERANCNCEISKDETECAVGPHLHFEVRSENGEPVDINGYIFSGFRVKTGLKSYDKGCGPEHCRSGMSASEVEASCSTIFIRLSDDETFCATHQGAGLGISNSQFFSSSQMKN